MRTPIHLLLAALLLAAPVAAADDATWEPVALEQALRAVREAPIGRLAALVAAEGRAGRVGAGAWTNPELAYTGYLRTEGDAAAINGQQHQLQLSVELPLSGEPTARRRAAEAAAAAAEADGATLRREAELAVGAAWADLRAAEERVTLGAEARDRFREAARVATARAELGAARRYEAQRVVADLARLERELAIAVAARDAASARLAGLLGRPGVALRAVGHGVDGPGPGPLDLDRAPAVVAAEQRQVAAGWALSAERRAAAPLPELTGGAYWTVDGTSTSALMGLALPLPVGDRNRKAIALARVAVDRAEAEVAFARADVAARVAALTRQEDALASALVSIDAGAVRDAAAARDTALLAWREGALGLVDWLDAERAWATAVEERVAVARDLDVVRLSRSLLLAPSTPDSVPP